MEIWDQEIEFLEILEIKNYFKILPTFFIPYYYEYLLKVA